MLHIGNVPEGLQELISYYGEPAKIVGGKVVVGINWEQHNLKAFHLPMTLRQSWDLKEVNLIVAHKKIGEAVIDALGEILHFYGAAFLREHDLDLWGGCYNPRFKRGSKDELSTHTWGIAVDYLPGLGGAGEPSRLPWPIVQAFLARGFENFPKFDGCHFQACTGY